MWLRVSVCLGARWFDCSRIDTHVWMYMFIGLVAKAQFLQFFSFFFLQMKWERLLVAAKMTLKMERTKNSSPMIQLLRWVEAESTEDHLDALVNWD